MVSRPPFLPRSVGRSPQGPLNGGGQKQTVIGLSQVGCVDMQIRWRVGVKKTYTILRTSFMDGPLETLREIPRAAERAR